MLPKARPFRARGKDLGLLLPEAVKQLERFPKVFRISEQSVELIQGETLEARSEAVAAVLQQLREEAAVPMLRGWRDEAWPVKGSFHDAPELVIERSAGPFFGVRGYGCHVNGLVETTAGLMLWVATRSRQKPTYPLCLDHVVAGGLSHGESPSENVLKECLEEASIPSSLASQAEPAGVVSYVQLDETGWGIKRDVIFCYDLFLPEDFQPTPLDGEVENFELVSIDDVIESLLQKGRWKPNVALVIIDMLVRRGILKPEEPGYVELAHALKNDLGQ